MSGDLGSIFKEKAEVHRATQRQLDYLRLLDPERDYSDFSINDARKKIAELARPWALTVKPFVLRRHKHFYVLNRKSAYQREMICRRCGQSIIRTVKEITKKALTAKNPLSNLERLIDPA